MQSKRRPVTVGDILEEEFLKPMRVTRDCLAEAMGVHCQLVNELCDNHRAITVDIALMLSRVFGTSAEFWLNLQRRIDLWEAQNSPERKARIERARPIRQAP
ncbi:HigA family addiction module antitoxin [Pseudomonas sp. GCM10022186]|uniref:HigA family addiction module antitoxin n=1 Tax=Pseudomonas sp. GCM10022186 TaxID=3252650 RepID=UPI00360EBAB5